MRPRSCDRGAITFEYCVLMVLVGLFLIATIVFLRGEVEAMFTGLTI